MDSNTFYLNEITFSNLPIFWKTLIIIGSISTMIFLILLVIIITLMLEKNKKDQTDLSDYDNFLNEFKNGKDQEKNQEKNQDQINIDQVFNIEHVFDQIDSGQIDGGQVDSGQVDGGQFPSLPKIRDFDGNILNLNLMQIEII